MDVFSNIKNVTQKIQGLDNIKQDPKKIQEGIKTQKNGDMSDLDKMDTEKLKKELRKLTEELNKALNPLNTTLKFKFNDKIGELTIQVIDTNDERVIREYPPKEALELMEKMREVVGMLFDKKG
ncbi:flagellar protein FlaG [Nautilia sp.]